MIYPGLRLQNRYKVIRQLGRGGIGETWEVDDGGTQKVLKVLLNNYPKFVELFKREADVLKQLNHPGIPRVEPDGYFTLEPEGASAANRSQIPPDVATQTTSDPGATTQTTANSPSNISGQNQSEPLHCLVMEFIEGQDLEKWLAKQGNQPIREEEAIDWLKQLVEILAKVHDQKYFHRDIKPSNIMRRSDRKLVLIDFGIVRELTETYYQKLPGQQVTQIGTLGYIAPEQRQGQAAPQSDFFALGRTFVYLLTGKAPTDFQEDPDTFQLNQNWRDSAPQISKPLADLIDDLMAPSLEKRPKKAEDILQRLALLSIKFSIAPILSSLPGIVKFWAEQILRDEFQKHIKQIRTPKIALYGRSGSGKSSLINAIIGKYVAEVSVDIRGTIKHESHSFFRDGWKLDFVDSRGVRDSDGDYAFQEAIDDIVKEKVDILLFVIPADERDVHGDVKFLTELKTKHKQKHGEGLPVILVLNKIDRIEPGSWNPPYNLSLEHPDLSRNPKNIKEAKEINIQKCIKARTEEYKKLTNICVPVCAKWNEWEDERYNIDKLLVQIYNCIPDEAAKNGFGGAAADTSLKKAVASRYTSTAAYLAFSVVWLPFFDPNAVWLIQNILVSTIAQIASSNEDQSSAAKKLLKQLGVTPTGPITALSTTFAIGDAAIHYFIDKEEIREVQQNYAQEEERLEPEFREAFEGGKTEVFRKLQEIDAELHDRYGVKRIYDEENGDHNINPVMQSPL